jgi:hypothetical protein
MGGGEGGVRLVKSSIPFGYARFARRRQGRLEMLQITKTNQGTRGYSASGTALANSIELRCNARTGSASSEAPLSLATWLYSLFARGMEVVVVVSSLIRRREGTPSIGVSAGTSRIISSIEEFRTRRCRPLCKSRKGTSHVHLK